MMPTDALLFPIEREALRKIVSSPEHDVIENMDRVAAPNRSYRRSNLEDHILEKAIISFSESEIPKPRAGVIDVFLLMLFPFLYLLDVISDCYVAYKHCSEANYLYFGLTLVFIFGPMLAELIGNMYWKGSSNTWKELFSLQSLRLLPRAFRSVWYAVDSRREFDPDQIVLYEELNRLRGSYNIREREKSWINGLSFAAMVENEREQLNWKLHEALNESAPQLLLQLVIVLMQLGNGETVGLLTIIGILASLTSFSWALHLFHYMRHYYGLKNQFKLKHRATDFVAHFLIVGCRFIALSMVMALYPLWLSVAAFVYQGFLFLYLYYFSSDRKKYRRLTRDTLNKLWMVHRLFITPYNMMMERCDDLFYHLETFALALSWPFLLDDGHPLADYRWIITAAVLILNFVALPVLLMFNKVVFEETRGCRHSLWDQIMPVP